MFDATRTGNPTRKQAIGPSGAPLKTRFGGPETNGLGDFAPETFDAETGQPIHDRIPREPDPRKKLDRHAHRPSTDRRLVARLVKHGTVVGEITGRPVKNPESGLTNVKFRTDVWTFGKMLEIIKKNPEKFRTPQPQGPLTTASGHISQPTVGIVDVWAALAKYRPQGKW